MPDEKFRIGDLVQIIEHYERDAGRIGRVADPAFPIKKHQEAHGKSTYHGHVRVDQTGSRFYWIEFVKREPGRPTATEVDEFALKAAQ
jgi:hypothetical protein